MTFLVDNIVCEHKDTTFFEMQKNYSTFVSDVF